MIFRRRSLPERLVGVEEGFERVLTHVERAKEAVMAAVPVARVAPRPLAEALFEFDTELAAARERMDAWNHEELSSEWIACGEALDECLGSSERIRMEAADLGFESFVAMIGELIAPLDAFEAAVDRFEELKS